MPEVVAFLRKYAVRGSKSQNPRERARIGADHFRQLSGRLRRFAERICHVEFSEHMN